MKYKLKIELLAFICFLGFALSSCDQKKSEKVHQTKERAYFKNAKKAIDSLKSHNLSNYLDSAYLYTYVYFGGDLIKRCGAFNIDSLLPQVADRKIVCQDLLLSKVRFVPESSLVFLSLTPLVHDSILSCDMVQGGQLPHEIVFDYQAKRFKEFVYDENSFLRVNANPIEDYENGLKKIIEKEKLRPHPKFQELLSRLIAK